jgi:hypothetical protein
MRLTAILVTLLVVSSALIQAQTRTQNQEKLIQFLTKDLQLTSDQTSKVRAIIKDADNRMAQSEMQYMSNPEKIPYTRKQILMDVGKKVGNILTPEQQAKYPETKKKLYDYMQARYESGLSKEQQEGAKANEMQPVETQPR